MPKVKSEGSVIHPNSRKAMKLAQQVYRNQRLDKRKGESNKKVKAKTTKLKWFQEHLDSTKEVYSAAEAKELIEQYLNRFSKIKVEEKEAKSLKRHLSGHAFLDFKTNFLIEKEKAEFNSCGLEMPDIMSKRSFEIFKAWNGDTQLLSALSFVKLSSSQLEKKESTL